MINGAYDVEFCDELIELTTPGEVLKEDFLFLNTEVYWAVPKIAVKIITS